MSNLGSDRYKWLKAVHQSGKLTACAKNLATVLVVEFLNTNTILHDSRVVEGAIL